MKYTQPPTDDCSTVRLGGRLPQLKGEDSEQPKQDQFEKKEYQQQCPQVPNMQQQQRNFGKWSNSNHTMVKLNGTYNNISTHVFLKLNQVLIRYLTNRSLAFPP